MRNILVLLAFLIGSVDAFAAPARGRVPGSGSTGTVTSGNNNSSSQKPTTKTSGGQNVTAQKTAQRGRAGALNSVVGGTTSNGGAQSGGDVSSMPVVKSRGGSNSSSNTASKNTGTGGGVSKLRAAKQNVVVGGTKVASATQNTLVDEACRQKFDGCMDSFCMLENTSGGRCVCSDKHKELSNVMAEIEKLDAKTYKMATVGVEKIEMGEDGDAVLDAAEKVAKSFDEKEDPKKSKRKSLNLDSWNSTPTDDVDDIFGDDGMSPENQEGDALYSSSYKLCTERMPECSDSFSILGSMYKQRVRSDCTAFENSLKQQKNASAQKLAAAEAAMREAALEQYRSANKYSLSQCTIKFKECMKTTAGCGDDFSGCAGVAAAQEAVTKKNSKAKKSQQTTIKGAVSSITIAAATFDTLEAKKPLCMDVTKNCVSVRDKVWDTFLHEVAPELKSAELIAESNLRTSCIGNISECFQKACKDTIDPKDPDGSYDMCLSRPETLESFCKVEITPCKAAEPRIMDYVRAKLSSMRVDACTKEVKACLQSEDVCGKDYTQCIGLDTKYIVEMCPQEKLVACYEEYNGETTQTVQHALETKIQGILLNIDNSILTSCQNLAQAKVVEICGSASQCKSFEDDANLGTESLVSYKDKTGSYVIDGIMNFGGLKTKKSTAADGSSIWELDAESYLSDLTGAQKATMERIDSVLNTVKNKVDAKLQILNSDPKLSMCINGRDTTQLNYRAGNNQVAGNKTQARFPRLLDSYQLMILNSAVDQAYKNYSEKLKKLYAEAMESKGDDEKAVLCAAMVGDGSSPKCKKYGVKTDGTGNPVCTEYEVSEPFDNIFAGNVDYGISDANGGTKWIIAGAKIDAKLKAATTGHKTYTQTDNEGNMMGTIDVSAVYSSKNNTCVITTTTTMCEDLEQLITTSSSSSGSGGLLSGCGILGGCSETTTTQSFHGVTCKKFGSPITTQNEIAM